MLAQVANKITDLQIIKAKAQGDAQIKEIDRQIEEAHDKRQVLIAEAGSRINAGTRFLLTLLVIPPLAKVLVWDKTIGPFFGCVGKDPAGCHIFNTDAFGTEIWALIAIIVGFYFVTTTKWTNK